MKHFTQSIPPDLAEKLKAAGMPEIKIEWNPIHEKYHCFNTYAEVFDWLMQKGILIIIKPYWNTSSWESYVTKISETDMPKDGREIYVHPTWHEAAEKAIEKALTLI